MDWNGISPVAQWANLSQYQYPILYCLVLNPTLLLPIKLSDDTLGRRQMTAQGLGSL